MFALVFGLNSNLYAKSKGTKKKHGRQIASHEESHGHKKHHNEQSKKSKKHKKNKH